MAIHKTHNHNGETHVFCKSQEKSGSFDKLTQQIEKMSKPQGAGPDERLWKLWVDKSGNGYAVIRFLPEPEGEDLPTGTGVGRFPRSWRMVY